MANQMKNAGLFVILFFRRKVFEKSTCFLLAGLPREMTRFLRGYYEKSIKYYMGNMVFMGLYI